MLKQEPKITERFLNLVVYTIHINLATHWKSISMVRTWKTTGITFNLALHHAPTARNVQYLKAKA
jgi:hypothetical protein